MRRKKNGDELLILSTEFICKELCGVGHREIILYSNATGRSYARCGICARLIASRPAVKVILMEAAYSIPRYADYDSDTIAELSPRTQSNNWQKFSARGDTSMTPPMPFARSAEWKKNAH